MRNLSLRIKYSFSKINFAFFCPALFYSTFISTIYKIALKNFKKILLVHRFDEFFCFLNWFLKSFLLNWFKNLRAHFGLHLKKGVSALKGPWRLHMYILRYLRMRLLIVNCQYFLIVNCCNFPRNNYFWKSFFESK